MVTGRGTRNDNPAHKFYIIPVTCYSGTLFCGSGITLALKMCSKRLLRAIKGQCADTPFSNRHLMKKSVKVYHKRISLQLMAYFFFVIL